MRHCILVVAQDVMLRSTLARWLMSAGYGVELAEGERRAREILAYHRVALTILVRGRSGSLALHPDQSCAKWIVVTEPSQDAMWPAHPSATADGILAVPLEEEALLAVVKSALPVQAELPDQHSPNPEILAFDGFTIDLAGRSMRDCRGEVPLTRSEFALLLTFVRNPGRVLSRDQLLDAVAGRRAEPY